ncbi:MAG: penicillin-binding protein 2 [Bacteroidetes bacterium]|nr:penicillin-binding protein 2 [Bacteroidota bacterium]
MQYRERRFFILGLIGIIFLVFVIRLFYLQVLSPDFAARAERNVIKKEILIPSRGIIYDRTERIYVTNTPIYNLYITPKELYIPDSTLFYKHLGMSPARLRRKIQEARDFSIHKKTQLEGGINADVFRRMQEQLWKTRGVYVEVRNTREYLYPVGANYLGYISEVNDGDIAVDKYYQSGDFIGTTGIERRYEPILRGRKGVRHVLEDVHGREVGPFHNGDHDTIPEKGEDLIISIDVKLQELGEHLMQHKTGSIVAIEPATGEILAFVSAPTYDPNYLVGSQRLKYFYRLLQKDTLKPLFNRPLQATYPPGSIFKVLNGLIALNEGTLSPQTAYPCGGGFSRHPQGKPKCHPHPSPLTVHAAIQHSCNAFFAATYVDMLNSRKYASFYEAYNRWHMYMERFDVGKLTGIDIPNEKKGLIPSQAFYDRWYGKNRWKAMTIVSNSIGQGEVTMTPLQMANVVCAIANRGHYIQPHFFKRFANPRADDSPPRFERVETGISHEYYELVTDAMEQVVVAGTGIGAQVKDIAVCGKTGTAENPHGEDHSVFIAFAPKENPRIALAVIIENAGFGGQWAAPMAKLMLEQYLKGKVESTDVYQYLTEKTFWVNIKRPDYSLDSFERWLEQVGGMVEDKP